MVEPNLEALALEVERKSLAPAAPRLRQRGPDQAGVGETGVRVLPVVGDVQGEDVGARIGPRNQIASLHAALDSRDDGVDLSAMPPAVEPPQLHDAPRAGTGVGAVAKTAGETQGLARPEVDVDGHFQILRLVLPGDHLDAPPV